MNGQRRALDGERFAAGSRQPLRTAFLPTTVNVIPATT